MGVIIIIIIIIIILIKNLMKTDIQEINRKRSYIPLY
jgi:hypothetical protein